MHSFLFNFSEWVFSRVVLLSGQLDRCLNSLLNYGCLSLGQINGLIAGSFPRRHLLSSKVNSDFCLYSQHGWVSGNLLVTYSILLPFPLRIPWDHTLIPIPPRWVRVSVSFCPSFGSMEQPGCASCLGENCSLIVLLCSRTQLVSQKEKESVGLLRDAGDLVTKDMRKVQQLHASFA